MGDEAARHEAAFKLVSNNVAVARFAARGAGEEGEPRFQAPLADPYAKPNEAMVPAVDTCLRHVATSLLDGVEQVATLTLSLARCLTHLPLSLMHASPSKWKKIARLHRLMPSPTRWHNLQASPAATADCAAATAEEAKELIRCLCYLRDRVGCPRDMGQVSP